MKKGRGNMKKTFLILCGSIIIFVLIFSYLYYNYQVGIVQAEKNNQEYESYTTNQILGSSLMTLMNKASNDNAKNPAEYLSLPGSFFLCLFAHDS